VLWSEKGPFHRMYDILETWRSCGTEVQGEAMSTGHFLPEQMPEELTRKLTTFLNA
jgi:haloacetate dehalogenase